MKSACPKPSQTIGILLQNCFPCSFCCFPDLDMFLEREIGYPLLTFKKMAFPFHIASCFPTPMCFIQTSESLISLGGACMLCLLHWQGDSLPLVPAGISLDGREVKVTFAVLSFFKTKHVSSRIIHTSYTSTTARINFHMI